MDRIFFGVIQDAANNAGDLLTDNGTTSDFAHAVLEAFAQNYRHGDEAAAKAAAAVITQFLADEAFERDCAIREDKKREAHDRQHFADRGLPLPSIYGGN